MTSSIDTVVAEAKAYLPQLDEARVRRAYEFAARAHEGQLRFSGEPYIIHPLEASRILLTLHADEDTLIATLLHDVPADTSVTLAQVEEAFGATVARLVQGTERLSLVKVQAGQTEVESWRRMFLAMAKDLRVVFIKLSERLHNMRTLEFVRPEKRARIAEETLRIYAPIASRLGIFALKSQLEDLCFKFLYPAEYKDLNDQLVLYDRLHHDYMEKARKVVEDFLKEEGVEVRVEARIKHLYSVYRKLKKRSTGQITDVYDLFAIRVILPDQHREAREFLGHCYTILGEIHNRWTPMGGRFKDYVAVPKLNGYRSLHTTVLGLIEGMPSQPVEVQIRTESMHREAEFGVASHWFYEDSRRASTSLPREEMERMVEHRRVVVRFYELIEEFPDRRMAFENFFTTLRGKSLPAVLRDWLVFNRFSVKDIELLIEAFAPRDADVSVRTLFFQHQVDWLHGLEQLTEELQGTSGDSGAVDVNLFDDRIFVLTPQGDVKDLPVGATPIDFAYSVHTDVGHRSVQAKVNGQIVGLDHELKSGDIVDMLTRKEPRPNRYWLSFVQTTQAKNRIKAWFRSLDREKNIKAGKEMLNKALRRINKPVLGPNYKLLAEYGGSSLDFGNREHIVEQVGDGTLTVNAVIRTLFSEEDLLGIPVAVSSVHTPEVKTPEELKKDEILITGQDKLPVTLSSCCKPKFPQSIVGYVTRGSSIRIHRLECRELSDIDRARLLEAQWAANPVVPHYTVRLRIEAEDRVGLMRDVLSLVADRGMSLADMVLVSKVEGFVVRDYLVEIPDFEQLDRLMGSLERLKGVSSVKKAEFPV